MALEHTEIERKYAVEGDAPVPDLSGLPGVHTMAPVEKVELVATYYDTPDLRLLTAGITLRHRDGGEDEGWHLKLPGDGEGRHEVRLPVSTPDEEALGTLAERVRVHVRDSPLAPTATLTTQRTLHRLLDEHGGVLADLCDDRVEAEVTPQQEATQRWREWELELVAGPVSLLDDADPVLRDGGAEPATTASKVSRVLAARLATVPSWTPSSGGDPTTGEVLRDYLGTHLTALQREDVRLRSGGHEGVHQLRVAARRLRSALSTYRSLLPPEVVDHLVAELRWLGQVLADARDAQVLHDRLVTLLEQQPPHLVVGPVRRRLERHLRCRYEEGRAAALEELGGVRYFRALDALEGLLVDPPFLPAAGQPARDGVPPLLQRDLRRVRRRAKKARKAQDPAERDALLHEVRKAAKRVRYAGESAEPALGKPAAHLAKRAKRVQQLLGEHQDTVVGRRELVPVAQEAREAGEDTFTLGVLHGLEAGRAEALEHDYPRRRRRLLRMREAL